MDGESDSPSKEEQKASEFMQNQQALANQELLQDKQDQIEIL
jgi:hypothetical protein